jgi:hypothetical protein
MILIFDLIGGFTDMLRDLVSIIKFTEQNKFNFTIINCSSRHFENPCIWNKYSVEELFDITMMNDNKYFINYDLIKDKINQDNTYNFFKEKIQDKLFNKEYQNYINSIFKNMLDNINHSNKEYIIIGGQFWYYSKISFMKDIKKITEKIKPSKKISDEYQRNLNLFNCKFNAIHYRYENDYINHFKKRNLNTPYIVPPIDELIENIPFKNNYKIFICTSMIESLYEKKLLYKELVNYDNLIFKYKNELNYDENAFLDFLLCKNCEEFYGNNISGFTNLINNVKNTFNCYNNMSCFENYNINI